MTTHRSFALLSVSLFLTALLVGCGSSNSNNNPPLTITTQSLPTGVTNTPYSVALQVTGGVAPYAWSVSSGALPAGLSLSRDGILSGTPTTSGGDTFSVTVTDSQHPASMATASLSITINAALQLVTTSLPDGTVGVFYSQTLSATGGVTPYTWAVSQGALPAGLTLNASSGVISGTPTSAGTSTFTVQVSDAETPAVTATAALSIQVNLPPQRNAALYTGATIVTLQGPGQLGLKIQSDGSLTPLPSSPETAIAGASFAASPTLPLLFSQGPANKGLVSLSVNPDYSLATTASSQDSGGVLTVDPTGANLYAEGVIDSNQTPGITIYPANGDLQSVGSIAVPNLGVGGSAQRMVFTPDGTLAFVSVCTPPQQGTILSFRRGSDGLLTSAASFVASADKCTVVNGGMAVSADGRYLATSEVQIYSIASDGTLTPVLPQAFTVTENQAPLTVNDVVWDPSGSDVAVSTQYSTGVLGGVAVLAFSGNALTQTVTPSEGPIGRLQQSGLFVYGMGLCANPARCSLPTGIYGYSFQNGQFTALPGSPYLYGNTGDMVIY